jgi:hypothetical protein
MALPLQRISILVQREKFLKEQSFKTVDAPRVKETLKRLLQNSGHPIANVKNV